MNRNTIISAPFCAKPQTRLKTRKTKFASWRTGTRPYNSERGPRNNGPKAYANKNMESIICDSIVLDTLRSCAICGKAGATIADATGEMKVNDDTTKVAIHFRFIGQFLGFSGSSGPFHVTRFGSLCRCDFVDLLVAC